ncbi:MAG: acetyl-CoA carboxylase biotin carboxyl carrier protein [Salibacteraceae bacterium]
MDLNEIQSLIKFVSKSGASEVELETKDFKIIIKTPGTGTNRRKGAQGEAEAYITAPLTQVAMPAAPVQQVVAAPAPVVPAPVPAAPAPAPAAEAPKAPAEEESNYITVKSPMIGTFYRSPKPDADPFISVGDEIKSGDVICIIEAMKLFNEIEAEVSGKVVKVLVDTANPVEYDTPLFLIDPS